MRQQQHNHRIALWAALAGLVVIAAAFGWYQVKVAPVRRAQAQTSRRLARVLAHVHGVKTKEKVAGGQAIYVLPKGQSVPAEVKATAKAKLAAMPKTSREKVVIATVTYTKAPLGLATPHITYEQLYAKGAQTWHRVNQIHAAYAVEAHSGRRATVAALVATDEARRAINYAAKQALVTGKHVSAARLTAVLKLPLLAKLEATNFTISDTHLTILDTAGKPQVQVALAKIKPYLKGSKNTQPQGKVIALTFDDGPNPRTTPHILQTLKQNHAKATFFMVGTGIAEAPQLARQVAAAGNEVGTHSYDHPYLPGLTPAKAWDETYGKNAATYYAAFDRLPPFIRPPYGAISKANAAQIELPAIQWDIDSQDWKSRNCGMIVARIRSAARPGSIILMHDIQPATVQALPIVISDLKKQGYRFVTVSELLGHQLWPSYQYFGQGDFRAV